MREVILKYIFLVLALLIPKFLLPQSAFALTDNQLLGIMDSTSDAALEGSLAGLILAYEMYDLQDHSDETITQKIKQIRWQYPVIGAGFCVILAAQADYITCVLMNKLDNYYNPRNL
jgi:hypothetical protein